MKKIKASILALLVFIPVSTVNADRLSSDNFNAQSRLAWSYVSDQVMGGVSEGRVTYIDENGESFARMTGRVSTENKSLTKS